MIGLNTASPTGSVTINGGAAYTTTQAVTLTLSAAFDGGTITQMRISNDGIFDTEPLEDYATSKSWTLPPGDGTKNVYVRFRSSLGSESDTVISTIMLDTTHPSIINSVTVSPSMAAAGDSLHVVVDATDLAGVSSVTADGVTLTKTGATTWEEDLTASSTLGDHTVAVLAVDALGYSTNSTGSYMTAAILGVSGRCLADPIMASASAKWLFRMWGKVTIIDANSFYLNDGSGNSIRVVAPGYSGIEDGDFVSIRGTLDVSSNPKTLTAKAEHMLRYN